MPISEVVQYPFVLEEGYYHYPNKLVEDMESFLIDEIKDTCPDAKIFRWIEE